MALDLLTLIKGCGIDPHCSWDLSQCLNAKPKGHYNCEEDSLVTLLIMAPPHKCLYPSELAVPNCSTEAYQQIRLLFLLSVFNYPLLPLPQDH